MFLSSIVTSTITSVVAMVLVISVHDVGRMAYESIGVKTGSTWLDWSTISSFSARIVDTLL